MSDSGTDSRVYVYIGVSIAGMVAAALYFCWRRQRYQRNVQYVAIAGRGERAPVAYRAGANAFNPGATVVNTYGSTQSSIQGPPPYTPYAPAPYTQAPPAVYQQPPQVAPLSAVQRAPPAVYDFPPPAYESRATAAAPYAPASAAPSAPPVAPSAPPASADTALILGRPTACTVHPQGHHCYISYRRADGTDLAGRLYTELTRNGIAAFFAPSCVAEGAQAWGNAMDNIDAAPIFLSVVTPAYINPDRMKSGDDFCLKEIERAVSQKKHIVPIIQEGFTTCFSIAETCPSAVKQLFQNDCVNVNNEFFQTGTMPKLINHMTDVVPN